MSNFDMFLRIRETYARLLPEWIAAYQKTGDMRQDPYFMDWEFSPIESYVWGDIRSMGLPFYPQIPVLNYFIDFGCPFLKIGIECDGKAWHDSELDKARDVRLAKQGWMIFRIEGHECVRTVEPWMESEEEERAELVDKYFMTTSEGILRAIKRRYFEDDMEGAYRFQIDSTLFEHMSTPATLPVRMPVKSSGGFIRAGDALEGYVEMLTARARKVAV